MDYARSTGATLRIDAMKNSIQKLMDTLASTPGGQQIKVSLYTFSNTVRTLIDPTQDHDAVRSAAEGIDLIAEVNEIGTSFDYAFSSLENIVGNSGTGDSVNSPEKIVFFMTDGIQTNFRYNPSASGEFEADPNFVVKSPWYNGSGAWSFQGFDASACDNIKTINQVKVATLNVQYVVPTVGTDNDGRFATIENYLADDIDLHMRECASDPQLALHAEQPEEIDRALHEFLNFFEKRLLRITH